MNQQERYNLVRLEKDLDWIHIESTYTLSEAFELIEEFLTHLLFYSVQIRFTYDNINKIIYLNISNTLGAGLQMNITDPKYYNIHGEDLTEMNVYMNKEQIRKLGLEIKTMLDEPDLPF